MNALYDWLVSHLVAGGLLAGMLCLALLVWRRASATQCCLTIVLFFLALVVLAPVQRCLWPEVRVPWRLSGQQMPPAGAQFSQGERQAGGYTEKSRVMHTTTSAKAEDSAGLWVTIWAVGAVLVLLRSMGGHGLWRRLWREAGALPDDAWKDVGVELQREMRARKLRIRSSSEICVPMISGRDMLVPSDWADGSTEMKTAALEHELAHLRHRDGWQRWLITLATALHWPSPFVWLAAGRLRLAQELRCDEAVLARDVCPQSYAAMLVAAARRLGHRHGMMSSVVASMARPGQLSVRLQKLALASPERQPVRLRHALASVMIIALCMQVLHVRVAAEPDAQQKSKAEELRKAPARPYDLAQQPFRSVVSKLATDAGIQLYGPQLKASEGNAPCDLKVSANPFATLEQLLAGQDLALHLIDNVWVACPKAEDPRATWKPRIKGEEAAALRAARKQCYDFTQAGLNDIVRFLATDARLSFISFPDDSATAQKTVSFQITDSPFAVLETVCRANGLALFMDNGIWYVSETEQVSAVARLRGEAARQYDFAKANLGDVLRFMAREAGIHCVPLPDDARVAKTLVTFSIKGSPFGVLETLCRANNLRLTEEHGTWFIREKKDKKS